MPLHAEYVLYNDGFDRDCYALVKSTGRDESPDTLDLVYKDADGNWHDVLDAPRLELAQYGQTDGKGTWHTTFV